MLWFYFSLFVLFCFVFMFGMATYLICCYIISSSTKKIWCFGVFEFRKANRDFVLFILIGFVLILSLIVEAQAAETRPWLPFIQICSSFEQYGFKIERNYCQFDAVKSTRCVSTWDRPEFFKTSFSNLFCFLSPSSSPLSSRLCFNFQTVLI